MSKNFPVRVFTLQGYDLRTLQEPIDHRMSDYNLSLTGLVDAKNKLYSLLETDQIVWCSLAHLRTEYETGKWYHAIEAHECDLVAVIDSLIWCHIIGYGADYILNSDRDEIKQEAAAMNGDFEKNLKMLTKRFLRARIPQDPWSGVLKETITDWSNDQVLLRFPFQESVVSSVEYIGKRPTN